MNTNNIFNQVPFLRTSREFPSDMEDLVLELNRSYIDIANAVNNRTISSFSTNRAVITGENYFINRNIKQQALRQVYNITAAGSVPHGIETTRIGTFSRIYGVFTDGTNWYPLPYVDTVSATNQISLSLTPTNIVITAGGGTPPTISSGFVVLEWLGIF